MSRAIGVRHLDILDTFSLKFWRYLSEGDAVESNTPSQDYGAHSLHTWQWLLEASRSLDELRTGIRLSTPRWTRGRQIPRDSARRVNAKSVWRTKIPSKRTPARVSNIMVEVFDSNIVLVDQPGQGIVHYCHEI